MPDDPTEDAPSCEGENCEQTLSEESCDEEELDAEEAERRITQFITSAEKLPGSPVAELAEEVEALMQATLRDLERLMEGKLHNKVLATQLLLGQRARELQQLDPEQRPLHAATSLLGGVVVRGAKS